MPDRTGRRIAELEHDLMGLSLEEKSQLLQNLQAQLQKEKEPPTASSSSPSLEAPRLHHTSAALNEKKPKLGPSTSTTLPSAQGPSVDIDELNIGSTATLPGLEVAAHPSPSRTASPGSQPRSPGPHWQAAGGLQGGLTAVSAEAGGGVASASLDESVGELKRKLHSACLELARRDAELLVLGEPQSHAPPGAGGLGPRGLDGLQKELGKLEADVQRLAARQKISDERRVLLEALLRRREARVAELEARCVKRDQTGAPLSGAPTPAPGTPSTVAAAAALDAAEVGKWRQKAAMLEEELRAKADIVTRLRQRELWFEQQLRRQAEVNDRPLRALLGDLHGLQEGIARLPLPNLHKDASGEKRSQRIDAAQLIQQGDSESMGDAAGHGSIMNLGSSAPSLTQAQAQAQALSRPLALQGHLSWSPMDVQQPPKDKAQDLGLLQQGAPALDAGAQATAPSHGYEVPRVYPALPAGVHVA